MQKNRADQADETRRVVFDDFIHVVDTLRFLAPEATDPRVHGRVVDGLLEHVGLSLSGGGRDALGIMNRVSGSNEETLEVSGAGAKRRIVDMAQVVDQSDQDHLTRRGDWTSVGRQRGFDGLCEHFLDAVRDGRRLSALDALETHRLCETVVRALSA
jgi:virulence factor